MINEQTFQGNWEEVKSKLRSRWSSLTEDDLFNGNVDQLVETIQRRTGEARTGIEQFFEQLSSDGAAVFRGDSNTAQERMVRRRPTKAWALCFAAGLVTGVVVILLCGGDEANPARRITD